MSILIRAIDILAQSEDFDSTDPESIYKYAIKIHKRVPDYEDVILQDMSVAIDYTLNVVKDRWPEAEQIIMKDPKYAYEYAYHVIKGRWPEAEPVIMKDPEYAYAYASNIIKGRWLEAEQYIKQGGSGWWELYQKEFGRDSF